MAKFFEGLRMIGCTPLSLLPVDEQRAILPELDSAEVQGAMAGKSDALHGMDCNPPPVRPGNNLQLAESIAYIDTYYDTRYPKDKDLKA